MEQKIEKILQMAIVTYDARKAAKYANDVLGIGPWYFRQLPPECGGSIIACCDMLNISLEFIQPTQESDPSYQWLKTHGQCVQSIAVKHRGEFVDIIRLLREKGAACVKGSATAADVDHPVAGNAVMDVTTPLGLNLEFLNFPEDFDFGYTDDVYPAGAPAGHNGPMAKWNDAGPAVPNTVPPLANKVLQLGIVVPDAVGAAKFFNDELGIGPWAIMERPKEIGGNTLACCNTLNVDLEFVQPGSPYDCAYRWLEKNGPSVQHIAMKHNGSYSEMIYTLMRNGAGITKSTAVIDSRGESFHNGNVLMDLTDMIGIIIEFYDISPDIVFGPPTYTYPAGAEVTTSPLTKW